MSEIAYSIHPDATFNQGCLILDLFAVNKEGHLYRFPSTGEEKSVSEWRALAKSKEDLEAFTFLLKEELQHRQKQTGRTPLAETLFLRQVHISPAQTLQALRLVGVTQKIFCCGKQLVLDFYGKTEFYYSGKQKPDGALEVEGRIRWRDVDVSLSECEAIGPGKPHPWFVRGLTLKWIQTEVSWKRLQELRQSPLILQGGLKQAFLEELDPEDTDLPLLVIKEGTIEEVSQNASPLPILKLTDRWGACADLWMDYGQGNAVAYHDPRPFIKTEIDKTPLKRQKESEMAWEKDLLETAYIKKNVGSSHYYCPLDKIGKSLAFLIEIGWKVEDIQKRHVVKQTGLDLQLKEQGQAITVQGKVRYDTFEADLSQIAGAFNRKDQFILLTPSAVGLLTMDAPLQAIQDIVDEGEITSEGIRIKKNQFGSLTPLWDVAQASSSLTTFKERWQQFKGIEEALPSSSFHGTLRHYQQEGVNWMAFLYDYGFHGILADEMGLGKTVQVMAFLSRIPSGKPHLIVMPTSLLFNWRNEITRFLPGFSCIIHQGASRKRSPQELEKENIILTSYTTLRLDLPLLQSIQYGALILDEAQMIKNAETQTAQAACQLKADLRLCLTGTPVENHLKELWSHFRFLIPELFGSKEQFEAEVAAAQADRRYIEKIKRKISPFLLRRRKKEVAADLPPRIDQTVWVEMSEEQRDHYDQMLAGFKSGLLKKVEIDGMGKHRMEVLEAILRLRQICCHPLLIATMTQQENIPSAKFDLLLEDLETIVEEGNKVLVYSQFTTMLHLMAQAAKKKGWSYSYLDGSTKNREEVVTRFQEDDTQNLFFISLKAGGVGLNLTAADYVYLYDPWWNEAVEEQAINRAHRIGRESAIIAKRFVVAESIEEKIMKLKAAKRMLIDDLLEGEEQSLSQLTIDDLQFLLS